MKTQSFKLAGVALVVASLAFTGCGSRTEATTGGGTAEKVATIGVIAPLSGDLSALGLGIRNSVDLAIRQANESKAIPGWTLKLDAQDDEAKPDVGKNAATKLASDDTVVGVVGTLNSSVAQSVIPVLDSAKIVQVSPANTNPALTKGADYLTAPARPNANYFRTCTTDAVQGPFAAQYLLGEGIKKVATIHDKKSYGQGLVTEFTKAFTAGGGTVVAAETINPDDKDFSAAIAKVKPAGPEAVYYGGEYPQAGPLSKQMNAAGLKVPVMGGDGIFSGEFIKLGGTNGDLATSVGAPVDTLESAKPFLEGYKAAGFKEGYEAYGAYSYDAANAIINALKVSLASATDAKSARQATIDAMAKVSFDGATGKVAFDEFGDSVSRVLTVYEVADGAWGAKKTGELK
ncbi:MAG TPA: branched-chain amino acid ABC transporter substrate-binding protein [Propionicimonas sp.]|nr:branched-chain amino acid ABC transporter substrate-binding protein [Propionicimonas sp.]HRA05360.1 branched-chain amino acid ABC transporter substrate-binding protein [Propionicimonas sp.]